MAKVRNEGNRNKLSFAAQLSSRSQGEEKTLQDFNVPKARASKDKHVDGTATKDHRRGSPPAEVAKAIAKHRGKDIHRQATTGRKNDGRSP